MIKKKKSKNHVLKIIISPILFILNIFKNIIKWFSLGFFKTFTFIVEYLIDLFIYVIIGFVFIFKYIFLCFGYIFKYFGIGVYSVLKIIYKFFWYFGFGVYSTFKSIYVLISDFFKKTTNNISVSFKQSLKSSKAKYDSSAILHSNIEKMEKEKKALLNELSNEGAKRTEVKKIYKYTAKNQKGRIVTGIFSGFSKLDVNSFLLNEGYEVYKIKTSKWIDFYYGKLNVSITKMKNKDIVFWLEQLSTYLRSGIPLTNAVKILSNQMGKDKNKKRIFESVVYELTMGESFSTALDKQNNVFPSLLINMIKAAEVTGELEETLKDLADYYNEIEKTRKQMTSALTYPLVILCFAVGVITFIMLYVIPQFQQIYSQSNLEIKGVTLAVINISTFLKNNIFMIILVVLLTAIVLVFLYKKIKSIRRFIQTVNMKLPVIGKIIIYNEMTIFTKTFASLLKNNVYITESMDILSKITKNEIYREIMFNTIANIAKGEKISDAFKDQWAVPEVAYYMIVTGESTGELANMMTNVSEYYQDMHRNAVSTIKSLIEPIMIVFLAIIVGVVILAVVIPMFDLYNSIEM